MSAFAARKAALAASPTKPNQLFPEPQSSPERAAPVPKPKRKPSIQTPIARKKQKKAVKHVEERKPRYFAPQIDAFKQGDDVIQIDSEESEGEETDEDKLLRNAGGFTALQSAHTKRAWSPSRPLPDSSDEEEEEKEMSAAAPVVAAPVVPEPSLLSTFTPQLDHNTFPLTPEEAAALSLPSTETATVLAIPTGQTLSLLGVYTLTVISGAITHSGVTLKPSKSAHRVFAPRSSPVPAICALDSEGGPSTTKALPLRLRDRLKHDGATVVLQSLRTGVEGLGNMCRTFENTFEVSRWQKSAVMPEVGIDGVSVVINQAKDVQSFLIPRTWEKALASVDSDETPGVYIVKGPKKSGKSTFARTVLNRLTLRYQKVAFLECDLGQSEFTPGGMVALNIIERPVFGAPFTHPSTPHQAHYIGGTSPRSSPSHYLTAIQALIQTYRLDIQNAYDVDAEGDERINDVIPLVVNTMGWTKGLGADLARKLEDIVEATRIFEVEAPVFEAGGWAAPAPSPVYNHNHNHASTHVLLEPIPVSVQSTTLSPGDHRTLSILSYFHGIHPRPAHLKQTTVTSWNTTLPLCAVPPYEVDVSSALDKIMLSGAGMEDVIPSELDRVLTCSIVGLVEYDAGTLDIETLYTQGLAVPSPGSSLCHGLAIIRAVSSSSKLQMLTPMHAAELERCRVLVKGEMEIPVWGMLDPSRLEGDEDVPFLQWGKGEGIGGEKRRVRRNLMRKGQM